MAYKPLLPGIAIEGYRSLHRWQALEFPSKVTVLAGINNSGKSNVLRFLQEVLPRLRAAGNHRPRPYNMSDIDIPRGFPGKLRFQVGVPINVPEIDRSKNPALNNGHVRAESLEDFQNAVASLLAIDGVFWSTIERKGEGWAPPDSLVDRAVRAWPNWPNHSRPVLTAMGGGSTDPNTVMAELLLRVGGFQQLPTVVTIHSARRVETGQDDGTTDWLSGRGIIKKLAALQNPSYNQDEWNEGKRRWAEINQFIRNVVGDSEASINIPHDYSTIQVETPDRVLPLSSLGSGIEQVVVLAAAATVTRGSLVCLEEPETNLHPLLQKKLIRYLTEKTSNQYIVATHSSHLLDDSRATAYHLRLTQNGTSARRARKAHELVDICNDLGYRPSDLMQANCVIWVEGPSDRIYLRTWLRLMNPELAEGIDYSIMFYGGKLLAHLTVDDDALRDFIDLRYLNRSSAILIDSDRKSARALIGSTKRRIRDEFEASKPAPGFAWITKCYTIENYIANDILSEAVDAVHPGARPQADDQWTNPFPSGRVTFDKIAIAREVSNRLKFSHLDRLDLKVKLTELVKFIQDANGTTIAPVEI